MKTKMHYYLRNIRIIPAVILLGIVTGCAHLANLHMTEMYGEEKPQQRMVAADSAPGLFYHNEVRPVIESRCVVCHGCYDAPCQLKLSSAEGIDRGASKAIVYDGARLLKAEPSRLFIDNMTTAQWRADEFYPVLNERNQNANTNLHAGVMSRLLTLKNQHPLPDGDILPDSFDFSLARDQQCPSSSELDDFSRKFPTWGMPYGLPRLDNNEYEILQRWLAQGARMAPLPALSIEYTEQVSLWERFLNGDSLKQRLVARYIYEHWFLAHLYFSDLPKGEYFRLVRSRTPPGQDIEIIATRRPYDDPGIERVYYRLWRERDTILDKTHLPYALNNERLQKYSQLFLRENYSVTALPSYEPLVAANPFKSFEQIPGHARYKFLLEEAQFTIMNFIKGPVCRGQVAVDVINDHFWVFFVKPDALSTKDTFAFYNEQQNNLALPSAEGSDSLALLNWLKYSQRHSDYLHAKAERMNEIFPDGEHLTIDAVWDGDAYNKNAALTVFRHFDSASVTKGLVGQAPQTAWIIDYSLLERIHYLLVAGFDVYGNVGHQLNSRLYMDFLRIEGEFNFLSLLPPATRLAELQHWYRGVSNKQKTYLQTPFTLFSQPSGETYETNQPKQELYEKLQHYLAPVLTQDHSLDKNTVPVSHRLALQKLHHASGTTAYLLSQVTNLSVRQETGAVNHYTLLHNNAHSNITSLLNEKSNRLPKEDTIIVVDGFIGAYPETFMQVDEAGLDDFVEKLLSMQTAQDYQQFMNQFGVRRTDPEFWKHSDQVQAGYNASMPFASGLLDYSRLENR